MAPRRLLFPCIAFNSNRPACSLRKKLKQHRVKQELEHGKNENCNYIPAKRALRCYRTRHSGRSTSRQRQNSVPHGVHRRVLQVCVRLPSSHGIQGGREHVHLQYSVSRKRCRSKPLSANNNRSDCHGPQLLLHQRISTRLLHEERNPYDCRKRLRLWLHGGSDHKSWWSVRVDSYWSVN
jgi:hypothetical protein